MAISGLVITYNEEKNIQRCVKTLFKVCEEVIIIDSNSSDKTAEIAEKHGAKVYYQKFLGDGLQRRHGLQFCKNDWILNPDTDEFLDEDALKFINSKSFETDIYDGYEFRRTNYLADEKIDFAEAEEAKEKARQEKKAIEEAESKRQNSSSNSRRRSTAMNPVIKVLTSATFIRSVFGILTKVMKK